MTLSFLARSVTLLGLVSGVALVAAACGGSSGQTVTSPTQVATSTSQAGSPPEEGPPTRPDPGPPGGGGGGGGGGTPPYLVPPAGNGTATVWAVGDIGWCGSPGMPLTGRFLQGVTGDILLAGDIAYPRGTIDDYRVCFDPDFGRFRARFRPVPGNHEYMDAGANGYFSYFGGAAGPGRQGYYSFRAASWHVLALNSSAPVGPGSPQYEWVRQELDVNRTRCTLAYWHHPFSSSGPNGPTPAMRDIWRLLYDAHAEVVVAGHDHLYERFAPLDPDYRPDSERGIRQFTAGTGGAAQYAPLARRVGSEAIMQTYGILRLTLAPLGYEWEFIDVQRNVANDRGSGACH